MALGDCWKQLSWFYYQYLLVTALYMLEPWERTVFSILSASQSPRADAGVSLTQHIWLANPMCSHVPQSF
uniref:Uncharacterized protein n=1 Tax=Fundulus heteroclitus TaxID=8078 RepID=A0A3Q2PIJ8_FUNHE